MIDQTDASTIASIDAAIEEANQYYQNKYAGEIGGKPPVSLYWTPTYRQPHENLSYFIVWACDERTMSYGSEAGISYFLFKGQLQNWQDHYDVNSKLDEVEDWVLSRQSFINSR